VYASWPALPSAHATLASRRPAGPYLGRTCTDRSRQLNLAPSMIRARLSSIGPEVWHPITRDAGANGEVRPAVAIPAPSDPERLLGRALDLPNAVWRFQGVSATYTRCLMLAFRYTAVSEEKREGLVWLGFNLGTGAAVSEILARLRPALAQMPDWQAPDQATKLAAGPGWSEATLDARVRPLLDQQMRDSMDPLLRAMRRRLERDRNRISRLGEGGRPSKHAAVAGDNKIVGFATGATILDCNPSLRCGQLSLSWAGRFHAGGIVLRQALAGEPLAHGLSVSTFVEVRKVRLLIARGETAGISRRERGRFVCTIRDTLQCWHTRRGRSPPKHAASSAP
jgi:hypothetical protein